MTSSYLFDSHARLAYFQKENGCEIVAKILEKILKKHIKPLICIINLGEIIYITKRRFGEEKKLEMLGRIHQLDFEILPVPISIDYKAAEFKAEYPISYADCFTLVSALENSSILVTGDPEFRIVEHLIKVEWIR